MGRVRTLKAVFITTAILALPTIYIYSCIQEFRVKPFDVRLTESEISEHSAVLPVNYRPKILIWAKQYHSIGWTFPDSPGDNGGCDVTWNRNEYSTSDAVVFYMKSCFSKDLPNRRLRSRHQAFIWWAHESPWTVLHYYSHSLEDFNNYFNWTMTYRRDADVLALFAPTPSMDYFLYKFGRLGEVKDKALTKRSPMSRERFDKETKLLLSKKSKFIAWVASDCDFTHGATRRMELVRDMVKEEALQIDKFGKCGDVEIPQNFTVLFQTLASYKFYLAFENSYHCRDYITEKTFYNALVSGAVPVIHGATKEDALTVLPSGSFIHVEDFKNISSLAIYLKYLDGNDSAYLEYFTWWRDRGTDVIPRFGFSDGFGEGQSIKLWKNAIQDDMMEIERFGLYHLCRKLRNMDHIKTSRTVPNLHELWYGTEAKECIEK